MDPSMAPILVLLTVLIGAVSFLQVASAIGDYSRGTRTSGNRGTVSEMIYRLVFALIFGSSCIWMLVAGPEPQWFLTAVPGIITLKWLIMALLSYLLMWKLSQEDRGNA